MTNDQFPVTWSGEAAERSFSFFRVLVAGGRWDVTDKKRGSRRKK